MISTIKCGTKIKQENRYKPAYKGPSIYDVHTEGEGVRLRWMHVDGGGGPAPCGRPHRKLKLESTDVILSTSHAKI